MNDSLNSPSSGTRLRILALGDCNTSGTGRPYPENCVPARLALRLGETGTEFEVQNLGYRMSTTREGVVRMERDAQPADVVLVNFGLVDAWITSIPRIYVPYYPDNFVRKQLRKLLKGTKRRLRSPLARRFVPSGAVVPQDEYVRNLRRIIGLARQWPASTVLLWGTALTTGDPQRTESILIYNARMRALAEELVVPYIDTPALMDGLESEAAYQDRTHLAEPAVERIAGAMATVIREIRSDIGSGNQRAA